MRKLIIVLTLAAFALTPSLPAGESKSTGKDKQECPAKKDSCPASKGESGGCCKDKDGKKQCPGSKDKKADKKA
jgi:hypothetical protein